MIDSSKSPIPAWRRYATIAILGIVIVVAGYLLWSKELHHSSAAAPAPAPAATAKSAASSAKPQQPSPSTTIPGGIPVSSRNPFGS